MLARSMRALETAIASSIYDMILLYGFSDFITIRTREENMQNNEEYIIKMQSDIKCGLASLETEENWLEKYEEWSYDEENKFTSILMVNDSFNLSCAGDCFFYDDSDARQMADLDVMRMSVFLSEQLRRLSRETFDKVRNERNRDKKLLFIDSYFRIVEAIVDSHEFSGCIVTLNEAAEKQMVFQGKRSVDLYVCYYSLRELLRKETTESLYLLYTYWRITKSRGDLKKLITAIIDYIQVYFADFDNDPQMHLYYPMDGLMTVKKLAIISHWLELIAFHTDGIFDNYKDLKWLTPVDVMADEIVETAQISKFEMLQYKRIFANDDNDTIRMKAIGNHGYAIWIKTVDVMHIFCDVCQMLCYLSEDELNRMNASKSAMVELYDNMTKIKNYYTGKVFFHQVYFELERRYLDSQVMNALEDDAQLLAESVDDVLTFVEAISSDDIDNLMQAKISYISKLKDFTTEEQEERLEELTIQIVEKIKDAISKKDVYTEMYKMVSLEFAPYAIALMQHPQIFCSLVSAEYLYNQYVENREPNNQFDYSCISIMYYMSLEDFVNKLVFIPYAKDVLSKIDKKNAKDWKWKDTEGKKYVSDCSKFFSKNGKVKDSCEIGPLGHLFAGIDTEDFFKQFLISRYNGVDIERTKNFGERLKDVAQRRNDAAHGGNYLTYATVCSDKNNVFNTVIEYKGMILELMNILFGD